MIYILYCIDKENSIKLFFKKYNYVIIQPFKDTHLENNIFGIKYLDGCNHIWKPKWSREARGRFYYIDNNSIIPLKNTLQRGIELLTKVHIDDHIKETQDLDLNTFEKFDNIQKELLNTFSQENKNINGYLTGKVDGSLLVVNYYPSNSQQYQIIDKLLNISKNILYIKCENYIITISTNSTLFIGNDMYDYFLTSLYGELNKHLDINKSFSYLWNQIKYDFEILIINLINNLQNDNISRNEMINLNFEMICKNRTTFKGKISNELAVGYDKSNIYFLGLTNNNIYYPHFLFKNTKHIISHPVYLKVNNTNDVFNIMKDLNKVVFDKMETDEFMKKYFPQNLNYPLHPEGFIYLHSIKNNFDYSKIKLPVYYKCHKIRDDNMEYLFNLPEKTEYYFPIVKTIKHFKINLKNNMKIFLEKCDNFVKEQNNKNTISYNHLNEKAKLRIDSCHNETTFYTNYKMLINLSHYIKHNFIKFAFDIWDVQDERFFLIAKEILMKNCNKNIHNYIDDCINDSNSYIKTLYKIMNLA